MLASVTGWDPDTLENMPCARFVGYLEAAIRKKLLTNGEGSA